MKLSEKILVIAKWLDSENNEILVEAQDNGCLDSVALSMSHAADSLRDAATDVALSEPETVSVITPESLDEMAAIAASFAESDDELLRKQASVLDQILETIGSPRDYIFNFKKAEDAKIEELKKKYKAPKEEIDEVNKAAESLDAIKKSPVYKAYRPLEAPMSTRVCIDHPGAQLSRVSDNVYQCALDHKIYDYSTGFTTLKGDKVPPSSVSEQTPKFNPESNGIFDTRDGRLGIHR